MTTASGFDFQHDIYPLGDFEAIPVTSKYNFEALAYPEVVRLGISTDVDLLRADYARFEKENDYNYFMSRARKLKVDIRKTLELFEYLGFELGQKYHAYPIRQKGTNHLVSHLGPYTKNLIETFKVETFRQQYVLAKKGWHTRPHLDHPTFQVHGYRMFIPLDTAYMGYQDRVYRLDPGDCYFVNIAREHRGFCFDTDRVVIMLQMASDHYILQGEPCTPIELISIPGEFREPLR